MPDQTSDVRLSVVVPCYRSESTIEQLVERLLGLPLLVDGEILLVCDGSPDRTWEAIARLARQDPRVRGIHLMRNFGQHNALLCGICASAGEIIVTMDDDLQHPPEAVADLVARLEPGNDVVYGVPTQERHGLVRDAASVAIKALLDRIMGSRIKETGAFRAFRGNLREMFRRYSSPSVSIDVLLAWSTTRVASVAVDHQARSAGRSGYGLAALVRHTLTMVTGYTVWPLRLASYLGFSFTLVGLGLFGYVVVSYLVRGIPVQGWPFLASTVTAFAGVQLFCLGVIGEYLARIYYRTMERPPYLVRETTGGGTA